MTRMFTREDIEGAFGAAPKPMVDVAKGLNPSQKEAVESMDGPVLIRAGAGTGKTTVLIRRTANIVQSGRAKPEEILLVTFTKKAAGEMRERLAGMLGEDTARYLNVGNFHAICSQMLRRHAHHLGLPQRFTVLDEDGQKDVIADLASHLGLLKNRKDKTAVLNFLNQIASWKEDGLDVDAIKNAKSLAAISAGPFEDDPVFLRKTALIFEAYQMELAAHRWCDFADLVLNMVRLFRAHPEVLEAEAGGIRYIMVDEFQDTSPVQNEWVTHMAKAHRNICVVGDTDQSIYEWRNARPEIMTNFPSHWSGCKAITIDVNYRSSQEILDVANAVVDELRRKDGLDKRLNSPRHGPHPREFMRSYNSSHDESEEIVDTIVSKINNGTQPSEIAILCRSGMIIKGIEISLRKRGLRYIVAGAMKFTDREEIKDAMAWLTLAVNPSDYIAFDRIASKPTRGLGPQKIAAIKGRMSKQRCTVLQAARSLATEAKPKSANARIFGELADLLQTIEMIVQNGESAGGILEDVLYESGYWDWRNENEKDPQFEQRMENLQMIVDEAKDYPTPLEFLEMVSLQSAGDKGWGDDCIVLSTVHASKGLEFDVVFTPAMEEGVFPNARSEKTSYGPDEERRLAHVAWTRARDELHVSYAAYRAIGQSTGMPSRYLREAGFFDVVQKPVAKRAGALPSGRTRMVLRPRSF